MNSKISAILTFAFAVLFATSAFGQHNFSFKDLAGEWEGTLEYLDYSSNQRVKLETRIVVNPASDGNSAEFLATYDDFGKVYRDRETDRIDYAAKKFYAGNEEFSIESIVKGKIILLGSGLDGEKIEPVRKTITYTDDSLTILKETRTPWQFRNQLTLKRVKRQPDEGKELRSEN